MVLSKLPTNLNKEIITLKTDLGLINTDYLNEMDIPKNSALIFTSLQDIVQTRIQKAFQNTVKTMEHNN